MPFLHSKGFGPDDLSFEKNFTLHLGKHTYKIDTEKQKETAQARLDILVTMGGKNLFIIEAKSDSIELTEQDRDQAVSYARLVHPMAPISIVTNGKDINLYDTVTKKPIDKNETKLKNYKLSTNDLTDIYEEALEYFIGYSFENVKIFCNSQLKEGMKALTGSKEDRNKKFIPETYVPSEIIESDFESFLKSEKPLFALVGESGSGKTCSMCGTALSFTDKYAVLFYRALDLIDGFKTIADDFCWHFSSQSTNIELFKKLRKIFNDSNLIIFIDGIDEWKNPQKIEIIDNFVGHIKSSKIKMVLSCKKEAWDNLTSNQDIPPKFSDYIYTSAFPIEKFKEPEFFAMVEKYRRFYNFFGAFEYEALEACKRLPFLLRIFFEVAEKEQTPYIAFSIREFYREYYQKITNKLTIEERQTARSQLRTIAGLLLEENSEQIDEHAIHQKLDDKIVSSLFENNILERTQSDINIYIGFYFQKLRDYLIAFSVKNWDGMSSVEFEKDIQHIIRNDIGYEALKLYYTFSDNGKRKILEGPLRNNAEQYLGFYRNLIDEQFPNLKSHFHPTAENAIEPLYKDRYREDGSCRVGFWGLLNIRDKAIYAYGFRPIKQNEDDIELIPVDYPWGNKPFSNMPYLLGADGLHYHSSSNGFRDLDIKKHVLKHEIIDQLEKLVAKYNLYEGNNYYLSLELALGIIIGALEKIPGYDRKRQVSSYLPINIETADYGLRFQKAVTHYNRILVDEKIKKGIVQQVRNGSTVSSHYRYEPGDWDEIYRKAREAAENRTEIKTDAFYRDLEEKGFFLRRALTAIRKKKNAIDETILPDKDASTINWPLHLDTYKNETFVNIVFKLFTLFLEEYKILIETNFPTLKNHFELYSMMPLHVIIEMDVGEDGIRLQRYKCKDDTISNNKVTMCNKGDVHLDWDSFSITYNKKIYKVHNIDGPGSVDNFMKGMYSPILNVPREFTILREMIYRRIKSELPNALNALKEVYGIV